MNSTSYERVCAAHRWEVPAQYNIASDVFDKHPRGKLAMVWESFDGSYRELAGGAGCKTSVRRQRIPGEQDKTLGHVARNGYAPETDLKRLSVTGLPESYRSRRAAERPGQNVHPDTDTEPTSAPRTHFGSTRCSM